MANRWNKTPKYETVESESLPPALLPASDAPAFAASEENDFEHVDSVRWLVTEEEEEDRRSFGFVLETILTQLRYGIMPCEDLKRISGGGAEGTAKQFEEKSRRRIPEYRRIIGAVVVDSLQWTIDEQSSCCLRRCRGSDDVDRRCCHWFLCP
jgi:hypothetical protein